MAHKVEFRDEALADLVALYDYIARESSPEIAISYIRRIQVACMRLATFPERGRRRERRVSIAFRVFKTRVEIVTIAYGGRDFENELRKIK